MSQSLMQCFVSSIFVLYTENGVKDPRVERAVVICKKIVSSFSFSWRRRRELQIAQKDLGLPQQQLITESPTRWGSRQAMIERLLEQEEAVSRVLAADKKCLHLVPTSQTLGVLTSINKAVKPLQEFTDALSGESYVTVSFVKPTLSLFRNSLLKPEEDDTDLTKTIKQKIMRYLTDQYSDPVKDELLDMACLMDPRFRTTYIDPDKVEHIKARVVRELLSLSDRTTPEPLPRPAVQIRQEPQEEGEPEGQAAAARPPPPPKKKRRSLASFFEEKLNAGLPSMSEEDRIKTELTTYLLAPVIKPSDDPLVWWKNNEDNHPRLSKLAKKYLAICATSAPSERLFSVGGNIVTCTRAHLKPDAVDRLVFLSVNLPIPAIVAQKKQKQTSD